VVCCVIVLTVGLTQESVGDVELLLILFWNKWFGGDRN